MKLLKILLIGIFVLCGSFAFAANVSNIQIFYVNPLSYKRPQNNCEDESCKALLNLINSSSKSIEFAIYGIGHQDAIYKAIINAQSRGVFVRGVVDMNSDKINPYSDTNSLIAILKTVKTDYNPIKNKSIESGDYKQQVEYEIKGEKTFATFINKDIKDYREEIMHNKYFIVDNEFVWTGSMNLSSSCTTYNSNVSVLVKSKELAAYYLKDFIQMYDGKFHKQKMKINLSNKIKIDDKTNMEVFLLPEYNRTYYEVSKYINSAEKYIYVPMFFFTHSKYPQDLINAKKRGVDVRVIMDATSARTGYSKNEILRMSGIPVKIENWGGKMHMKSLIIDDKYSLIGSMNFTSSAHYTNDENSIMIENVEIAESFKKHFLYLWDSIPDRWLVKIPKPEGRESKNSCTDGIDNDHDGLIDRDDPDCHMFNFHKVHKKNIPKIFIQTGPVID